MRSLQTIITCAAAAIGLSVPGPDRAAAGIINVTFTSTTNNAYNDKAYLQNTGISVQAGDIVHLIGSNQIYVGGGQYVRTNFDMGLISPLNSPSLIRNYYGLGNNYTGTPVPLTNESVLFSQQRSSLSDNHDLVLTVPVLTSGYMYIGMFDSYFADNTGSHSFAVQVTPEPSTLAFLALGGVLLCRRVRRTNSLNRGV